MRATPRRVRTAIRKAGLPYDIEKTQGSWYVFGGDSCEWSIDRCLYVATLDCYSVEEWVEIIKAMALNSKK